MKRPLLAVLGVGWFVQMAAAQPADRPAGGDKFSARLTTMPDNSWLRLDPALEPAGRNNCGVCLGAGKVFYFGGTRLGYQGNDVELYDLSANAWTRSWTPEFRPNKDYTGKELEAEAVFSAQTGRPWPFPTYQQVCYVPERKVFFYAGHVGTWQYDPARAPSSGPEDPPAQGQQPAPAGGGWTNLAGPHSEGKRSSPHTLLAWQTYHTFYSPPLKAPVCIVSAKPFGVYVYDFDKGRWAQRDADIPVMMRWYEHYSTYVESIGCHLIAQRGKPFMWLYDPAKEEFKELAGVPEPLEECQALAYDRGNDVVIALSQFKLDPDKPMSKVSVKVWAWTPRTKTWAEVKGEGPLPEGFFTGSWAPLWHDPEHEALFFLNRTTQTGCETWAYRYKKKAQGRAPDAK